VHNANPMSKSSHKNAKAKAAIDAATTTIKDFYKKQFVQHNYHDHASDKIDEQTLNVDKNHKVSTGGVTIPFPIKLHNMLEHIESIEPELSHVIS